MFELRIKWVGGLFRVRNIEVAQKTRGARLFFILRDAFFGGKVVLILDRGGIGENREGCGRSSSGLCLDLHLSPNTPLKNLRFREMTIFPIFSTSLGRGITLNTLFLLLLLCVRIQS